MFQDVDFNNKERFPDAVLERLLQHFEKHPLRHADVEDDVLGNTYEYLIAKFADDAGKKGGEFYTPKMVVRLMVECLAPDEKMRSMTAMQTYRIYPLCLPVRLSEELRIHSTELHELER